MSLARHFHAALLDDAPLPQRQTPLPRIPPKKAPPIAVKVPVRTQHSPVRRMNNSILRDVSNHQDLGTIVSSETLPTGTTRVKTTLTTVHIRYGCVVRGRIHKRALHGVRVEHVNPFA